MKNKLFLLLTYSHIILAAKPHQNRYIDFFINDLYAENFAKDIVTVLEVHMVTWQGRKAISGTFIANQGIPNMNVQITLNFEKPDKTRFEMFDIMIDVCKFLNGTYDKLRVPSIILKEVRKQKGLPQKCPIEANTTYSLDHYVVRGPQFPLPNLKFIATLTLYKADKKTKLIRVGVRGATKRYKS